MFGNRGLGINDELGILAIANAQIVSFGKNHKD